MSTKLYRNTGKETLIVRELGELKPGEQVSVSGDYLPQIILENFPGLVDITDLDESGAAPAKPAEAAKPQINISEESSNE